MNDSINGHRRRRLCSYNRHVLGVIACLLWGLFALPARAVSLDSLLGGASLNVGNSQFRDWELASIDSTAVPSPDLSLIDVLPLLDGPQLNPGVQFVANGQLATLGINAIDLNLKFRVDAQPGSNSFENQSLAMTGASFGGPTGTILITSEATDGVGNELAPAIVIADNEADFFQFTDNPVFAPKSQLFVETNVFLTGISASDDVALSTFSQRFSQTGPPSLLGDYNQNGFVDAADYTVWRDQLTAGGTVLANDPTPGAVSESDFVYWRGHFGESVGSGAASAAAAVPEPGSAILFSLALLGVIPVLHARNR